MNISKFKIVMKFLFGGKEAVLDYVLEVANNFVAKLSDTKQEEIKGCLEQARKILAALEKYSNFCPNKWINAYMTTVSAFADIVDAMSDLKLTPEEIEHIYTAFKSAYASWLSDDSVVTETAKGDSVVS
jgi:hypothetical protein